MLAEDSKTCLAVVAFPFVPGDARRYPSKEITCNHYPASLA
ncbi:hypothetical protein RBSWK_02904 [Rhodopirellula baltica SWK14]|uniref:Uncharacterized protein n=1 Tax=Rhodopirellula baltica SWK14 TaxID=993516 RepID=L7CGD0_RHOBT|nr:hypothetical protein RBSWK_02904 [Rhodopirellula baltica SWK14]